MVALLSVVAIVDRLAVMAVVAVFVVDWLVVHVVSSLVLSVVVVGELGGVLVLNVLVSVVRGDIVLRVVSLVVNWDLDVVLDMLANDVFGLFVAVLAVLVVDWLTVDDSLVHHGLVDVLDVLDTLVVDWLTVDVLDTLVVDWLTVDVLNSLVMNWLTVDNSLVDSLVDDWHVVLNNTLVVVVVVFVVGGDAVVCGSLVVSLSQMLSVCVVMSSGGHVVVRNLVLHLAAKEDLGEGEADGVTILIEVLVLPLGLSVHDLVMDILTVNDQVMLNMEDEVPWVSEGLGHLAELVKIGADGGLALFELVGDIVNDVTKILNSVKHRVE